MQLSLSPKYHHVILTTGGMANVCPIALTQRLSIGMRTNALQMMAAVCATHPTTPTAAQRARCDVWPLRLRRATSLTSCSCGSEVERSFKKALRACFSLLSPAFACVSEDCELGGEHRHPARRGAGDRQRILGCRESSQDPKRSQKWQAFDRDSLPSLAFGHVAQVVGGAPEMSHLVLRAVSSISMDFL